MSWGLIHPDGPLSGDHETLPRPLPGRKGVIAVSSDAEEVRQCTGRQWRLLTGDEREYVLDWLAERAEESRNV